MTNWQSIIFLMVVLCGCTSPQSGMPIDHDELTKIERQKIEIYRECLNDILMIYGGPDADIYLTNESPEARLAAMAVRDLGRVVFQNPSQLSDQKGAFVNKKTGRPAVVVSIGMTRWTQHEAEVGVSANVSETGGEDRVYILRKEENHSWSIISKKRGAIS